MQVNFPHFIVNLGNIASASQVKEIPELQWQCDPNAYYTLLVSNPTPLGQDTELGSEAQLWRIGNVKDCDVNKGQTLSDYIPAWPLKGTGLHRFVYLLFKQKSKIFFEEPFLRDM